MDLTGPRPEEHLLTWGVLLGGGGLSLQRLEPWRPVQDNVQNNTNQKHPPLPTHTTEPFAFHQCSTETDNNCGNLSHTLPLGFVCGPDAPLAQGLWLQWFFESCACVLQDRVEGGVP